MIWKSQENIVIYIIDVDFFKILPPQLIISLERRQKIFIRTPLYTKPYWILETLKNPDSVTDSYLLLMQHHQDSHFKINRHGHDILYFSFQLKLHI